MLFLHISSQITKMSCTLKVYLIYKELYLQVQVQALLYKYEIFKS